MKMSTVAKFAGLALAAAWLPAAAEDNAADMSTRPLRLVASDTAGTVQCDPPCVEGEICCKLSGLEAACVRPEDCFSSDGDQKLIRK